jgi:hypothetical protein
MATITFPSDAGDYAFVVDGQHRIFSFRNEYRRLSESEVFELPVVCFQNARRGYGSYIRFNQREPKAS